LSSEDDHLLDLLAEHSSFFHSQAVLGVEDLNEEKLTQGYIDLELLKEALSSKEESLIPQ